MQLRHWWFGRHCLSFYPFSVYHCIVCSSLIYYFWLPLWYLQLFLIILFQLIPLNVEVYITLIGPRIFGHLIYKKSLTLSFKFWKCTSFNRCFFLSLVLNKRLGNLLWCYIFFVFHISIAGHINLHKKSFFIRNTLIT